MLRLLSYTFLALALAPAANAQAAATRVFNLVETPANLTYGPQGEAPVFLEPTATGTIIRVAGYRKVSIRIGTTQATSFQINMGKVRGTTLSQFFAGPIDDKIHTFDIVGPHLALSLTGGPPGATEQVQLWVYLSS